MRARDEQVLRLAQRRRNALGAMSDGAFQELLADVRERPREFVDCPEEEAFAKVASAVERFDESCVDDDLLDDEQYFVTRTKRLSRMRRDCEQALEIDPACTDARLLLTLASDLDADDLLDTLGGIASETQVTAGDDAWDDVFARPALRVRAALGRTCIDASCYRLAVSTCEDLLALAPSDALGARHTAALAYARLEDEEGFAALEARYPHGSAWERLAQTLLLYKLGRLSAARRSLRGYSSLVRGGAYALLKPVMVDTYMPDRPELATFSFEEATLAVHEADPIVVDVPDFIAWCEAQDGILDAAQSFANSTGLDW